MKYIALMILSLSLTGCASVDYQRYADAQIAIATARGNAEAARYKALGDIAKGGDTTAQVAAAIALMAGSNQQQQTVAAPKSGWDSAREWAQVLVPAAAQAFGYFTAMETNITASNNSRDVSVSTNNAFVGVASKIQAPAVPQANVSTTTTNNTDRHDTVDSRDMSNHSITSSYNPIEAPVVPIVPVIVNPPVVINNGANQ